MATWKTAREFVIGEGVVKALEVVEAQAAEHAALIEDLLVRPTLKHGDHDQSTHGHGGGGGSAKPSSRPQGGGPPTTPKGWKGSPGKNGSTTYKNPDYPEEQIRVKPDGSWVHSDDDGPIAWGRGNTSLTEHLSDPESPAPRKKEPWTEPKSPRDLPRRNDPPRSKKKTGPMIDNVRQDAAPRKRLRLL